MTVCLNLSTICFQDLMMFSVTIIAILALCLLSPGQTVSVPNCDGKCVNIEVNCEHTTGCEDTISLLDLDKQYKKIFPPPPIGDADLMEVDFKVNTRQECL